MSDTAAPVLVYERIDANRRNTLLLLPAFGALLLPLAYSLTQLLVPFFFYFNNSWMMMPTEALQVMASIEAATLKMVLFALALAFCVALAGYLASTYFLLWLADGRRADRRKELVLWRTVENLCLGAGLSQPAVYVVESSRPNAFSTARDSKHASLIVTRGLLQLLDERELRGVLAHELSHIGNRDTDLSNLLAALVAMTRLPLAGLKAFVEVTNTGPVQALVGAGALLGVTVLVVFVEGCSMSARHGAGMSLNVREVMTLLAPLYALFIAPAAGMFVRETISHQREFLADADAALLTRDPEALALALAKVGAANGSSVNAFVATSHLYFVDPLPRTDSWWDRTFPSHPPVDVRVALLARMGDGISDQTLSNAAAAGFDYAGQQMLKDMAGLSPTEGEDSRACVPGARLRLTDSRTLLYKSANQASAVLARLDANLLVTVVDLDAQFIHVRLVDGTVGYIRLFAGLKPLYDDPDDIQDAGAEGIDGIHDRGPSPLVTDEDCVPDPVPETRFRLPGTQFRLTDQSTPLYAKPDGWSDVVQQLSPGTVVTFNELVGSFARVTMDGAVGYISANAGADAISPA